MIKQISVFLQNEKGRLEKLIYILSENDLNIRALSIADTEEFGVLRLIVNDPDKAKNVLNEKGFRVSETEVIAVEVPDVPGGLAGALHKLTEKGINIDYMYAFLTKKSDFANVIFRVEDTQKAEEVLNAAGVKVLGGESVYM
ncbi:ACT domain protein [Desulfonispora thiosulfatigenes DSM 11270]|uniref:ACT domain protein n=1 Tax=Desulfonispora thiosulfatigenes DSM 11270 TaxID=656914 RepID=A0A1W1V7Y0_DESTI|nr:ACT domain-containing protein [Desulfonispora thiosulfatigenes]SMB89376.1 ACT domain protein [Desulfonispora thiosulfatigenes DSM 11270]